MRIPSGCHGGYTARMNKRLVFVSAAFAIALPLALSGCGNKGPLVLPGPPAEPSTESPVPVPVPETVPETVPPPAADTATPPPPADGTSAQR